MTEPGRRIALYATGSQRWPRGSTYPALVIAVLVLTQRLALPLGGGGAQVPLSVPLLFILVAYGIAAGYLTISRLLAALLGLSLITLALLTGASYVLGDDPSITSFILFVVIYLPAIAISTSPLAARAALRFFVDLMAVAAVVGLVLFGLQYAGLAYVDHLAEVVPKELLLQGFNTADPIRFGSPVYRSNGVVFLEPSFFSMFLGLAIAVSVSLRHRTWLLPLLLSAIVSTVAGNGVVVVAVAALWLLVLGPRSRLVALVPSFAIAAGFATVTPLAALFLGRSAEVSQQNSSASLRFVQPYTELLPRWFDTPMHALVGSGAGSAQRIIVEQVGSAPVIVPVLPKLLVEYGLVGTVPVLAFLIVLTARRIWWSPWAAGLMPVYLIVNASLLVATLAATAYVFASMLVPRTPAADQRSSETTDGTTTRAPATANP